MWGHIIIVNLMILGFGNSNALTSDFIVIASAQRSGSTQMAIKLNAHPCVFSFNEYFNDGEKLNAQTGKVWRQSDDAYNVLGSSLFNQRRINPTEIMKIATTRKCEKTKCKKCSATFKLFHDHLPWEKASLFFTHPNATVVLLNRNPDERYCSYKHAKKTGDWETKPSITHIVNHTKCQLDMDTTEKVHFIKKHWKWTQFVTYSVLKNNIRTNLICVPFKAWTENDLQSEQIMDMIYLAAGQIPLYI